ncbi:PadR family transcriptional regulator [Nocardia aurantiaca]|uniref:PadR family transcriptional regulator n=1 Tax=Nocardia aurantiaca TaxID=2675850 RepID=A0A6I3KYE9_9NOCA|nr:PadR family transcriptional regulator [Nocardia aurantiaca]MTE13194.1 PadR family transcriptional regulator [Nocardia aurantiaca]
MTDGVPAEEAQAIPELPTTAWAVLGMLSHAEELSGYDLKKWADWSLQFFYWSPSFSQIYAELKRLEKHGYATSRTVVSEDGMRGKRMYSITESGREAASNWVNHSPVEAPVLKHSVMLRAWLGHLAEPERMREILTQHIEYTETMRRRAEADAEGADVNPDWAYPSAVLRWCVKHYEAEKEFAEDLLVDLDKLARQRSRRKPPKKRNSSDSH